MDSVKMYMKNIGKCSVCNTKLKEGDYLAAGSQMKPFCKKCERFIYRIYISKKTTNN